MGRVLDVKPTSSKVLPLVGIHMCCFDALCISPACNECNVINVIYLALLFMPKAYRQLLTALTSIMHKD